MPVEGPPVLGQHGGQLVAGVPVQRGALPGRLEQLLLVGLAVHRDELVGEVGEQRHRYRAAARVRA